MDINTDRTWTHTWAGQREPETEMDPPPPTAHQACLISFGTQTHGYILLTWPKLFAIYDR